MNIYITLDYELFFGKKSGTVEKSVIEPTNELVNIANKHDIKFVFFVDIGYLLKLRKYQNKYTALKRDYKLLTSQLRELSDNGHELQLHIHPHWEDSYYEDNSWKINTSRYRLHDFAFDEISNIVKRYKKALENISSNPVFAFRAGGWSIQPFKQIREVLKANNIWLDSTVFKGGKLETNHQSFNFKNCPDKTIWEFQTDLLKEEEGFFLELPISSIRVSPLFYWKLIFFKIFWQESSKAMGDGDPIYPPFWEMVNKITLPTYTPVSIDGYKASLLQKAKKQYKKRYGEESNLIIMGHPKGITGYSLNKLDEFLSSLNKFERVVTFTKIFKSKID